MRFFGWIIAVPVAFIVIAFAIANRTPVTVPADYLAAEALALLNERKVSALLVLDQNDTPVGVLHMHDFLRAGVM